MTEQPPDQEQPPEPVRTKREKRVERMIAGVEAIIQGARDLEDQHAAALAKVHPAYEKSARNLIHYRALRQQDIRKLQKQLGDLGLSRLGKAEEHVMANLLMTRSVLQRFIKAKKLKIKKADLTFKQAPKLLRTNTKALLGYRSKGRRTLIMVTLPSEAAVDAALIHDLLAAGMNTIRINCAHDGPEAWGRMIRHAVEAQEKVRKSCRISMDLGGPKIRTGSMAPGPRLASFHPERDVLGRVTHPALVWLGSPASCVREEADACLPVPEDWIARVRSGDIVRFVDTRGKKRALQVVETADGGAWAHCDNTAYVLTGTELFLGDDTEGASIDVIPTVEQHITLKPGDRLVLHRNAQPGEPAVLDDGGNTIRPAHISVTAPEIFARVHPGERVLFDDGKIGGVILEASAEELIVTVSHARAGTAKLRADKGINFPDSDLQIRGLTEKDKRDLAFVAGHADVVNMSFVNSPQDVEDLLAEIDRLGGTGRLGIILKIETRQGFESLTEILLTAMQAHPVGVMIARGDLAIECGWESMARIQDEIMSLCEAAHIPVVWATQVLDSLAKKGLPSRAEITDAATAQRAECVMLNKGPHITSAIGMLDTILKSTEAYQDKKAPMLPVLEAVEPETMADTA